MSNWPIEIVRQSGFDLWTLVCAAASLVLLSYIVLGKAWQSPRGLFTLILGSTGILGTLVIIILPPLHIAVLGMVWTFLLLGILSTTFYLNLREQLSIQRMALLLTMRLIALLMLVPMLFDPEWHIIAKPKPEKPLLFLIDTSGSMSFPDSQNGPTRLQAVWQALRPEVDKIHEHFIPSYFTFDSSTRELKLPDEISKLQADGKSTDIVGGIKTALSKTTRDDAAVVLISDGIDNVSADAAEEVRASAHPIHTVRVGSDQAEPSTVANVAVDSVDSPDDFPVDHEVTIKANIKSTALANRVVDVKISEVDDNDKPVGELKSQKLVLQPTPDGQVVELPYKATTVGLHKVAVWIDPVAGERSLADNRQEFQGLAIDPRIKVLYIEGSVRLEYKWTRQAFISDSNIELATFLRKSNTEAEAAGTVEGEKFGGLPTTPAQWKKFDVIVIGDIDSSYFSLQQQQQIEQFVSNGGGLLMLGGQSSFGPGGYESSPIEKTLPVFVGSKSDSAQDKNKFVPRLTPEGQTQPILEGLGDWFGLNDKPGGKTLPPLNGNVIVAKPKAGAQVLMVHEDRPGPDGKPEIVLAVQRYGQGRSAAFTVDTTYLWFLPLRGMGQESPYNKLWGQMIRWLAGQDVRDRQRGAGLEALLNKSTYLLGENVKLRARVRDQRGDATSHAQVSVTLTGNGQKPKTLSLVTDDSQQGMYQLIVPNPSKGDWQMEVVATKDGKELGRQKLTFTVIPPADEMLKIAANPKLLTDIANQTRGFHYELGQLPQLIDQLIRADPKNGQPQEQVVPLDNFVRLVPALVGIRPDWQSKYDMPTQGLLILSLLVGEWFLRRRWQLT